MPAWYIPPVAGVPAAMELAVGDASGGLEGGDYARGAFRGRFPRWVWIGLVSWLLAGVVLLVVPAVLGWIGGRYQDDVTDELAECRTTGLAGLDDAATADTLFRVESWFPFWKPRAAPRRAELVAQVAASIEACRRRGPPPDGLTERGVEFVVARLPEVYGAAADPPAVRRRVEEFLLASGREKELLALAKRLPHGGDVERRVRAHLRLGDPSGAADAWRAPGAGTSAPAATHLGKGIVLCLAGEYDAALLELDATWRAHVTGDPGATWRAEFLGAAAECALRAGDLEALERFLAGVPRTRLGAALAARYRAELGEQRLPSPVDGGPPFEQDPAFERTTLDDRFLPLALAALDGTPDELLAAARSPAVERELHALETGPSPERLFDDRSFPPLDEPRLRAAIDVLAGLDAPGAREAAAGLLVLLGVRLGVRWDPRLEETLARAASLRPGWTLPQTLRTTFRALHGEGTTGGGGAAGGDAVAGSGAIPRQDLEELLRGAGTPAPLSALFLRLTRLVVAGRALQVDVKRWEDQLAALRAMVDAQPNPRLLRFAEPL
ncbi:MAG: hypothetical protein HY907_21135 [Deltaproteobacteria bacterium]|nr:hypothetical protein [Deltaproteobacteria bacterium]